MADFIFEGRLYIESETISSWLGVDASKHQLRVEPTKQNPIRRIVGFHYRHLLDAGERLLATPEGVAYERCHLCPVAHMFWDQWDIFPQNILVTKATTEFVESESLRWIWYYEATSIVRPIINAFDWYRKDRDPVQRVVDILQQCGYRFPKEPVPIPVSLLSFGT